MQEFIYHLKKENVMRNVCIILLSNVLLGTHIATASDQSLSEIEQVVIAQTEQMLLTQMGSLENTTVTIKHLDNRLKLQACMHPLQTSIEHNTTSFKNMTIRVSCSEPAKWSVRVPVQIQQFKPVLVSTKSISRDQPIGSDDYHLVMTDVNMLTEGYFQNPDDLKGLVLKNTISAGTVIKNNFLKQPILIKRGETVKIIAQAPGLNIETVGIAQMDGIKNQSITVRNQRSNKIIDAIAHESGVVIVNL